MVDGVTIALAAPRSIAAIGAFRDQAALQSALLAEFGVGLPAPQRFLAAGNVTLASIGPGRFWATGESAAILPRTLGSLCKGLAAVTDQSDLWKIFVISGSGAREALSRVVPVDLHPLRLPVGAVVLTRAENVDVRLFRIGESLYELAVGRSYANDMQHALHEASHDFREGSL